MTRQIIASTIIFISFYIHLPAQVVHVPADSSSIQAAINGSLDGDTILVAEGTYFENINFNGKAITVASQFLIDRDTSHISKTIIDGSQTSIQDSASVVYFISDEDTTSVLTGFTITGGSGTFWEIHYPSFPSKGSLIGGGVLVDSCGGKISNNIIENNHIDLPTGGMMHYPDSLTGGAGISGSVHGFHTLIIRDNIIRNNSLDSDIMSNGGGIQVTGANLIIEGNEIYNNQCKCELGMSNGGGIAYFGLAIVDGYDDVIIRNNRIYGNKLFSNRYAPYNPPISMGGAIFVNGYSMPTLDLKVYNNLMYDNYTEGEGGGLGIELIGSGFELSNNTIVNNEAEVDGNDMYCRYVSTTNMYNNILWSDSDNGNSEISINPVEADVIKINAFYNNIKGGWEGEGNIDTIPGFEADSYNLAEGSPCIGNGIDTIEIDGKLYFSPVYDFAEQIRPHSNDHLVDMGALESPYKRSYDPTVGIQSRLISDQPEMVYVYPNPTNTNFTIEMKNANLIQKVEILSLDGRIVRIVDQISTKSVTIDRNNLPSGMYFLRIYGKSTIVKKVMVE